ncbi:MAG TPA: 4Fe-4S dicluster domain-containing protein [Anaerolineae bacterium]|nr:4Fe-4S dicluster domain-containing protein [Anaerolineae bacterium]
MSLWVLDKEAMASFVTNTMADYRVVGPVAKGTKFAFDRIEDPADLRLDYDTSILPPKKYLQPQEERMMTFTRTGEPVVELDIDAPPTVVLGVHTCDLHGMRVLDEAFSQGYPDASYLERRKKTLLVGIECLEPCDEHSFCKSMGTLTASEGYDLHLTDLGDSYAVDVGSSTGRTLLQKNSDARQATEADMQRINRVLGAKWPRFPYKLEFDVAELSTLMAQSYENPIWDRLAEICLACGQCTLVCPTCFCFNVYDEVELNLANGERWRRWDSCQLDEFARVAGGENFREHQAARLRHRFMRKGRYLMEKYEELGCTGCGRCARSCLVDISPEDVFNELHGCRM